MNKFAKFSILLILEEKKEIFQIFESLEIFDHKGSLVLLKLGSLVVKDE